MVGNLVDSFNSSRRLPRRGVIVVRSDLPDVACSGCSRRSNDGQSILTSVLVSEDLTSDLQFLVELRDLNP